MNTSNWLEHRVDVLLWFLTGLFPAFVSYVTWITIYGDNKSINGLSKDQLLPYFVAVTVLWYLVGGSNSYSIGMDIKDGGLNQHLLQPLHPMLKHMVLEQGWKLSCLVFIAPVIILLLVFNVWTIPNFTVLQGLVLIISIIFAATIFSIVETMIGMSSFWILSNYPIKVLNDVLSTILSGRMIPLAFFPLWAAKINDFFYYRYTFAAPLDIMFTPEKVNCVKLLAGQVIWIIILLLLFNFMYKKGIKRYEATGA